MIEELAAARAREAATREILSVISQSRDDERPAFDAMLRSAIELCGADTAALFLGRRDDARMTLAAWRDREAPSTAANAAVIASVNATDLPMDPVLHASARAILSGEVVHIVDGTQAAGYLSGDPAFRIMIDTLSVRTYLNVPLIDSEGALGVISLHRSVVLAFDDDEIALIRSFAAQAVIAIENARQFRELQTRLEREAATREILSVISQSRDDNRPVFDMIAQSAARLCRARYCTFWRVENGLVHYCASHGFDQADFDDELLTPVDGSGPLLDNTLIGQVVKTRSIARIEDGTAESFLDHEWVRAHGLRQLIGVPIFVRDDVWGSINLMWPPDQAPRKDDIQLVESFAAQASIAIENVRQFRELQQRLAHEAATREILEVISQSRDDDRPVFNAILHRAADLCHADGVALILGREGDAHPVIAAMTEGIDPAPIAIYARGDVPMDAEQSYAAKAIVTGKVVHIADMKDTEGYRLGVGIALSAVHDAGIRTAMFVPLLTPGGAIGCLNVFRKDVRPYTADEIALLETFAAQAVIAIENVRQFRELQERLAHEAATREILEVISQSRDDDRPVFDAILHNAARLCGAKMAGLLLGRRTDSHVQTAASFGWNDEATVRLGEEPILMDRTQSYTARSILDQDVIHLPDMAKTDLYLAGARVTRIAVDDAGVRAMLLVPLLHDDEAIGTIALDRLQPDPFSQSQIDLVKSFAAQAVIAIENVRQFRELQTRLEREAATREILEVISGSRDDEKPVFDVLLRKAAQLCGAPMANLSIITDDGHHSVNAARWGEHRTDVIPVGSVWPLDLPHAPETCMREGRIVHIHDLADTDLYLSGDPARTLAVDKEGVRTLLCVPLVSDGRTLGCISTYRHDVRRFTPDEIALVETFAAQAVIAIENVRQFRELQSRLEREAATRNILRVISESPDDEQPTFEAILDSATRLCGTPYASLVLGRRGDASQRMVAHRADIAETLALFREGKVPMDPEDSIAARAILEGSTIHVPNMADTDQYRAGHERFRLVVDRLGLRTNLFVPLLGPEGGIGCFILWKKEVAPFTADQITLMETFASHAVIAIENVRQFKALEALNAELGDRVQAQVGEIERMGRLKRFLPAAVADAVVTSGSEKMLSSHRTLLGVLFCDIRGFTAFCETAEPEETIEVLQTYHEEMGKLINAHGAGVDHRMGDGIMVLFNDPLPCDDPAGNAVRLALAMRARMAELCQRWKKMGHRLGFGVGVSLGYATVGMVGSGGRFDYTASGTAINLASRLADEAQDGEILLSPRARTAVEDQFPVELRGEVALKGIREPVEVFRLTGIEAD